MLVTKNHTHTNRTCRAFRAGSSQFANTRSCSPSNRYLTRFILVATTLAPPAAGPSPPSPSDPAPFSPEEKPAFCLEETPPFLPDLEPAAPADPRDRFPPRVTEDVLLTGVRAPPPPALLGGCAPEALLPNPRVIAAAEEASLLSLPAAAAAAAEEERAASGAAAAAAVDGSTAPRRSCVSRHRTQLSLLRWSHRCSICRAVSRTRGSRKTGGGGGVGPLHGHSRLRLFAGGRFRRTRYHVLRDNSDCVLDKNPGESTR